MPANNVKHRMANTREYNRWSGIKQRCFYQKHNRYKWYGGRGVTMHAPWVHDFACYWADVLAEIGPCPEGMSIDRINNDGNYEPGNIRWASSRQQRLNRK